MSQSGISRRALFRTTGATALAMSAGSYSRVLGANDRIQLGLIGCGGRGIHVMEKFLAVDGVETTAVCDVYAGHIDKAKAVAPGAAGYRDHRELTASSAVDAVLVATPDHWHAVTAIDALNAGKDVYVEKPLTLKIEEGPEIVKAARVNKRVCQVGMQQRSGSHYLEAKEKYIQSGLIGKVTLARTWWYGNGAHLRIAPPSLQTKPSNLDWARYLGPVSWREYDPQQYYNFRAYLEFGGGQITDLFTHWIDAVHMMLEEDDPVAASASGGVYYYRDGRTAPDTICALLEYRNDWTATFEATLAPGKKGAAFELCGTEGSLWISRDQYEFTPAGKGATPTVVEAATDITQEHVQNFIDCVRSRKRPNGDVYVGHRSAQASHLANIAYVQKRRIKFDPVREEILPL